MAASASFPGIAAANTIATAAIHASTLASDIALIKNIDQTNMASTAGVMTTGTSAPTGTTTGGAAIPFAGAMWHDTNAVTNGPLEVDKFYNGGATTWVAALRGFYGPNAPSLTEVGHIWRDTTLHMFRRYESATTAANGVAGWHPLDVGFQLWKNESGATLNGNLVVIEKIAGTDGVRAFTTTTVEKNQQVLGVTMEVTAPDAYGVVAMIAGGATVDVQVLGSTFGAVAKGDVLVHSTTAGKAREAGALVGAGVDYGVTEYGVQTGGFAEALAATSSDGLVRARLLGSVGTGRAVIGTSLVIWVDTTPPTSDTRIDVRKAASGSNGAQGAVSLGDASHAPLVAWQGYLQAAGSSGTYTQWSFDIGPSAAAAHIKLRGKSGDLSNDEYFDAINFPMSPTADATSLLPGSETAVKYTADSGAVTWTDFRLLRTGYIC